MAFMTAPGEGASVDLGQATDVLCDLVRIGCFHFNVVLEGELLVEIDSEPSDFLPSGDLRITVEY
jgi:hypothetical protein